MIMLPTSAFLALGANICFSFACLYFSKFAHITSPLWVNLFKASVALILFAVAGAFFSHIPWWEFRPSWIVLALISGGLGLGIADIFFVTSFQRSGVAPTLMFFALQPLLLACVGYFWWHEPLALQQWIALLLFISSVMVFSFEKFKETKTKQVFWAMGMAFLGVMLDAAGIILSKQVLNNPGTTSFALNFWRALGAVAFFLVWNSVKPIRLSEHWIALKSKEKWEITFASILGTFLSLSLYLTAIKMGPAGIVSAIAVTGPIWASLFEFWLHKKKFTAGLVLSLILFVIAFCLNTVKLS
jgi:drug/metabolite transporter (DMT)-like permease